MANYGDISSNIILSTNQSIRRNSTDSLFEAYIPVSDVSLGLYATNVSVGSALSYFIRSTSIGTGLVWDGNMIDVSIATGVSSLASLSDVSIVDLSSNQFLQYDSSISKWRNISSIEASSYFWELSTALLKETSLGTGLVWNAGMLDVSIVAGGSDASINFLYDWDLNQDASIVRIDTSLNNTVDGFSIFLPNVSIGTGFYWLGGLLNASTGGGGTGDVTKLYVDGSLATKVSKAGDTMTGNLTINVAAPKLKMTDTNSPFLTLGLASEVGGQLVDFGSNYNQLNTIDASYPGGYFRIDLRDAYPSQFFAVHYVPVGGAETTPFKLSRTGDLVTDGSACFAGNVGIGTIAPVDKLHINSATTNSKIRITDSVTGATNTDGLTLETASGEGYLWNAENLGLHLATNNTERLTILAGGNVGIGTTTLDYWKLAIEGTPSAPSLTSYSTGILSIGHTDQRLVFSVPTGAGQTFSIQSKHAYVDGNPYHIALNPMGGNVGIGTTAPQGLLHLAGSGDANVPNAPIILQRYWAGTDVRAAAIFEYTDGTNEQLVFGVAGDGEGTMTNPATYAKAKMVIQANGKVGIGTTTPAFALDVPGMVRFGNSAYQSKIGVPGGTGVNNSALMSWHENTANWFGIIQDYTEGYQASYVSRYGTGTPMISFFTGLQADGNVKVPERMRIDYLGNVGIGTTAPDGTARLHVASGGGILVTGDYAGAPSVAGLAVDYHSANNGARIMVSDGAGGWSKNLLLQPYAGNVGIGTDTPLTKLEIKTATNVHLGIQTGEVDTTAVQLISFIDGAALLIPMEFKASKFDFIGNVGIGTTAPLIDLHLGTYNFGLQKGEASPNAGYIRFGDNSGWKMHIGRMKESAGSATNTDTTGVIMTFQDTGNVGIGEAAPATRLVVNGGMTIGDNTATADNNLYVVGTIASGSNITAGSAATAGFITSYYTKAAIRGNWPASSYWGFGSSNNGAHIKLDSCDSVGTWNASGVILDVIGAITASTTITATSTMTASNFILSSDKKLKTNIIPLKNSPVNVEYKEFELISEPGQKRYGVIAQDLQKTNPELIRKGEDGMLSVAYFDLLILEINSLKERVKELEGRIG